MPRVTALPRAWVLEGLELQMVGRQADSMRVGKKPRLVCGHQVGHRASLPDVTVQPKPTVHCVGHSIAPPRELTICGGAIALSHPQH